MTHLASMKTSFPLFTINASGLMASLLAALKKTGEEKSLPLPRYAQPRCAPCRHHQAIAPTPPPKQPLLWEISTAVEGVQFNPRRCVLHLFLLLLIVLPDRRYFLTACLSEARDAVSLASCIRTLRRGLVGRADRCRRLMNLHLKCDCFTNHISNDKPPRRPRPQLIIPDVRHYVCGHAPGRPSGVAISPPG